jgi:hypothetical protein
MKGSVPFLGTTTDRGKAFSGIKSVDLRIIQRRYDDSTREHHYSLTTVPPHLACMNPRCQQGGLELQQLIWIHDSGLDTTYFCGGHEGTPKGRRVGDPCDVRFEIKMSKELG